MKNIYRRRKGMTLIESIIGVALFSILIIPISGVIMTAFQTSKKAETKQRASYVGQSILEEMEVYDKILLKDSEAKPGKKSFKLLDGEEIYKSAIEGTYISKDMVKDEFSVEVTLIKDENFEYEISNEDNINESKIDFELELLNDSLGIAKVKYKSKNVVIPNEVVLKVADDDKGRAITLRNKDNNNIIIEDNKSAKSNNKISIYLNETFDKGDINIEIENEIVNTSGDKEYLDIYIKTHGDSKGKVNIMGIKGKIKIYENVDETANEEVGDLYNIKVDVIKNSDILFTGETVKNINIKE